ncbi:hypothetical protein AVEN_224689-1 [Araneus ventricosus]|uniref:Uncharacterized protein n=1 Tax=Araneus ventricosus TaxID=182803 RepID=A0A4Y2LRL9_ARAVE|nr:hypothetical protein AVEN_224689-1 [Araneus ventricosus]
MPASEYRRVSKPGPDVDDVGKPTLVSKESSLPFGPDSDRDRLVSDHPFHIASPAPLVRLDDSSGRDEIPLVQPEPRVESICISPQTLVEREISERESRRVHVVVPKFGLQNIDPARVPDLDDGYFERQSSLSVSDPRDFGRVVDPHD